jgi:hypothetical protein
LELTVTQIFQNGGPNEISPGDIFVVPIAQFQGTLNGDTDQVRFINDGLSSAVTIRIDGQTDPLPDTSSYYVVMPTHPEAGDDLIITLGPNFPTISSAPPNLYIEVHIQYGPGRGVARRPDSVHGVTFETAPTGFLYHPSGTPSNNFPMHVGWSALRSSFRNEMFKGLVPVTTEAYADPGSKTLILTPFRQIGMPANFLTMDGTAANLTSGSYTTLTKGATTGTMTFTDTTDAPFTTGMAMTTAIVVTNGPQPGRYTIVSYSNTGQVTLDRAIPTATELNFTIEPAQGLMPLNDQFGNAKWTQTDPLQLFASCTTNSSNSLADKNLYVQLPRELVPAWGEYHVPIVVNATYAPAGFSEGVNYMLMSSNGTATGGNTNYLPYVSTGVGGSSSTYQTFSTLDLTTSGSIAYNTALTYGGLTYAGMQQFNDVNGPRARGLGRQGLELPPFYGVARLFAVYEASDYTAHGSAYSAMTRIPTGGGATNLLRQNMGQNDGPTFWVEIDNDRDSTFILNANAIDITRAPTPISSFSAGNYVIEATIFGFDRGFFDITHEARLVLSASRPPNQATGTTRASNIGIPIIGPNTILPGPLSDGISVLATYSRTPYMGDAWGSQTGYTDITPTTGPLLTSAAYQISSTTLTPTALTRPNQKLLEVVASIGFVTTLGTGCAVGDHATPPEYSLRNIGYEDPTEYPPTTIGQDRPTTKAADFMGDSVSPPVGSEYLGCTERLPLGALFRDKDFRGESFGGFIPAPFMFTADGGTGLLGGLAVSSSYEQSEALVQGVGLAAGQPGNFLVAVDGNQTNYTQLTNYRVNRGGSVFNASGHYPGGEVASIVSSLTSPTGHTNVLCGRAFLVRNTVTNVNASEVSAGDELMMLVVTSVVRLTDTNPSIGQVIIGTNGSFEGYSAADLYRCEGHPLLNDNVRNDLDPSTIPLAPRAF